MDNWRSYEGLMKVRDGEEAGERDGVKVALEGGTRPGGMRPQNNRDSHF